MTKRENDVLTDIRLFRDTHYGNSPNTKDLRYRLGVKSDTTIIRAIEGLIEKGHLRKVGDRENGRTFLVPTDEIF